MMGGHENQAWRSRHDQLITGLSTTPASITPRLRCRPYSISGVPGNIAHQALIHGHTVLFISAGQLLGDLAALDSDSALRRRHYAGPRLLVIDEVSYLS
jgi:hypothetical protein